jgi:hypothetical protein
VAWGVQGEMGVVTLPPPFLVWEIGRGLRCHGRRVEGGVGDEAGRRTGGIDAGRSVGAVVERTEVNRRRGSVSDLFFYVSRRTAKFIE